MKKTKTIWIYFLAILSVILIFSSGCKKKDNSSNNAPVTTVTDKDGNVYHTVTIGTQVWMVENLKTTKYNDGSSIPLVTVDTIWGKLTTPAYCWYNNTIGNNDTYGTLYNWYAVQTGKLAPTGWHIPTQDEWLILINYVGGPFEAGGKLKEKDTIHWASTNVGATDDYGFTALPGGYREVDTYSNWVGYNDMRKYCGFWTTSEYSATEVADVEIYNQKPTASLYSMYKNWGISVRCIKN